MKCSLKRIGQLGLMIFFKQDGTAVDSYYFLIGRNSLGLTGAEADSLFNSLLKDSPQGEEPAGVEQHPVAVESKAAVLATPPQAVASPR